MTATGHARNEDPAEATMPPSTEVHSGPEKSESNGSGRNTLGKEIGEVGEQSILKMLSEHGSVSGPGQNHYN